jgi:uncharacterized membrane protein YhaH (DUF805 family)
MDLPSRADDPMPPWRMLLDPRGRIGRADFWRWGVGALGGLGLLGHALLAIAHVKPDLIERWVTLSLLWPAVAISAKRWHDRDRTAWWVLVALLPVAGWLWALLDNGLVRGTPGRNRFGEPPGRAP